MRLFLKKIYIFQEKYFLKKRKKIFSLCIFTFGQVVWNNQTTCEIPHILSLGRSPGTIRPLVKLFTFFFLSGRSPKIIKPLAKFFVFLLHHRVCHLEQLDHLQFSLHFIIRQVVQNNYTTCEIPRILSLDRSLGTIRPFKKFFTFFFLSDRSPEIIRPLAKFFAFLLHYQASHLE